MTDPLQPSIPGRNDFGRHTLSTQLIAGWPCRWCQRPLARIANTPTSKDTLAVACGNCDNPGGKTP